MLPKLQTAADITYRESGRKDAPETNAAVLEMLAKVSQPSPA